MDACEKLKQRIKHAILEKDLAEGARLGTLETISRSFGFSRRITHQAVGDLVKEGLLQSKQGLGTFVNSLSALRLDEDYKRKRIGIVAAPFQFFHANTAFRLLAEVQILNAAGFATQVYAATSDAPFETMAENVCDDILYKRIQGVIASSHLWRYPRYRTIAGTSFPFVSWGGIGKENAPFIVSNDHPSAISCLAGEYARLGIKSATIFGPVLCPETTAILAEAGVSLAEHYNPNPNEASVREEFKKLLSKKTLPDALHFSDEYFLHWLMKDLVASGIPFSGKVTLSVATTKGFLIPDVFPYIRIEVDPYEVGRAAARLFIDVFRGKRTRPKTVLVSYAVVRIIEGNRPATTIHTKRVSRKSIR
jgi:DNA-binding LacI/PurR family transcriptional regulator